MAIRKVGQIKQDLTLKEAWGWAKDKPHPAYAIEALAYSQEFVRVCITEHDYPESFYSIIEERDPEKEAKKDII